MGRECRGLPGLTQSGGGVERANRLGTDERWFARFTLAVTRRIAFCAVDTEPATRLSALSMASEALAATSDAFLKPVTELVALRHSDKNRATFASSSRETTPAETMAKSC